MVIAVLDNDPGQVAKLSRGFCGSKQFPPVWSLFSNVSYPASKGKPSFLLPLFDNLSLNSFSEFHIKPGDSPAEQQFIHLLELRLYSHS